MELLLQSARIEQRQSLRSHILSFRPKQIPDLLIRQPALWKPDRSERVSHDDRSRDEIRQYRTFSATTLIPSPLTPRSNSASKAILLASLVCFSFSLVGEPVMVDLTEGLVVFLVGEGLEEVDDAISGFWSGVGLVVLSVVSR
jgi:hypothetical protein